MFTVWFFRNNIAHRLLLRGKAVNMLFNVSSSLSPTIFLLLLMVILHNCCSSNNRSSNEDPSKCDYIPAHSNETKLLSISPVHLSEVLQTSCALLCILPCSPKTLAILHLVSHIFSEDSNVFIGQLSTTKMEEAVFWKSRFAKTTTKELAFYELEPKDRSCLLSPSKSIFRAEPYLGPIMASLLVQFVNEKCGTYRTAHGNLNAAGRLHLYIMTNLYHSKEMTEECLRVDVLDQQTFFQNFLLRSRPVIIEGGAKQWPAMTKWSSEYLGAVYGNKRVHIKLTENGIFEGVEDSKFWESSHSSWIPESVRVQLLYPDLVVVRPATAEMRFSEFLKYITSVNKTYSAYLEYSSIPFHMPVLEDDIREMAFLGGLLERKHLNLWLSDGDTLGKLHFDPFDNFLCQISGEKHLMLFNPHSNENLYEGHIPEAKLSFDPSTGRFSRHTRLESTSMVMSPLDITEPDLHRFPRFAEARRLRCVLRPGDVLFMPAFWWHEVQSYPDPVQRRNLAVNYWYEPVLTKEFPCADCRMKFNRFYRHFLDDPPL